MDATNSEPTVIFDYGDYKEEIPLSQLRNGENTVSDSGKDSASEVHFNARVRLRELLNNVRELEANSNSKNWTNKITGIRLLVEQYADEIEEGSGAKSIEEIEKKLQCLQDEFENRDSELDGHCQSKRLKLLTKIQTLKWVLNRAT